MTEPVKLAYAVICLVVLVTVQTVWSKEIGPADDYCKEINDSISGMEIVLRPGAYRGSCQVRRGGKSGSPLIIRAQDLTDRPRIAYQGTHSNVLEIYSDNIVIQGLAIGLTHSDVDGIRIFTGSNVTVEDCVFAHMGGIAIVTNHASIKRLIVRRNTITNSAATAMYFGCHDGTACTASELLIEKNFIRDITARASEIGYGIQVKLNSFGTIRDNVVINTKGPGIMVYGAEDLNQLTIIERNFVAGSRQSSGIVIGGGPAMVRNNVVVDNSEGGVGLEDYGRRGLLRKIVVTHNTVYNNERGGILIPSEGPVEAEISRNAVSARAGTPLFPAQREGVRVFGNQDCHSGSCFVAPANLDFTPAHGSSLLQDSKSDDGRSSPSDDYFGRVRNALPAVGAIELPGGPIRLGIKP